MPRATLEEMAEYYFSSVEDTEQYLQKMIEEETSLVGKADVLWDYLEELLCLGKIQWRIGTIDPRPTFERMLHAFATWLPSFSGLKPHLKRTTKLKSASLGMISRLVHGTIPTGLQEMIPPFHPLPKNETDLLYAYPDIGIHEALISHSIPDRWDAMLKHIGQRHPAAQLLVETNSCYMDIIATCFEGNDQEAELHVVRSCELYESRMRAQSTCFTTNEGDEITADLFADHRLGTIIHCCFNDAQIRFSNKNIPHLWKS